MFDLNASSQDIVENEVDKNTSFQDYLNYCILLALFVLILLSSLSLSYSFANKPMPGGLILRNIMGFSIVPLFIMIFSAKRLTASIKSTGHIVDWRVRQLVASGYLAAVFAFLSSYILHGLSRFPCNDNCDPSVPTVAESQIAILAIVILWIALAAATHFKMRSFLKN